MVNQKDIDETMSKIGDLQYKIKNLKFRLDEEEKMLDRLTTSNDLIFADISGKYIKEAITNHNRNTVFNRKEGDVYKITAGTKLCRGEGDQSFTINKNKYCGVYKLSNGKIY
jgi:hypothetical protein